MSEKVYFAVRIPRYHDQWQSWRSKRRPTKVPLFGVLSDEVPTLRHLLDQERDCLDVRLDCLQGFCFINESEDIAHYSRQANHVFVAILLVDKHLHICAQREHEY